MTTDTKAAHTPGPLAEAFETATELIQEAKGAEGPNGGFVTDHLDFAEQWLGKAQTIATELLEVAERILERGYVSEHIEEERDDHLVLKAAIAKARGEPQP